MGATVTTGKCAAAFRSSEGELLYILFERHYEKNCYPHTPKWSAFAFGTRNEVLRRAFIGAADCCGGMLQSPRGEIKPENYIESWKQELNRPVQMPDIVVKLKFEDSWQATLPASGKDEVRAILERAGCSDRFDMIAHDGLSATLYGDTTLLRLLYGVDGGASPWRVFSHHNVGTLPFDIPTTRNIAVQDADLPVVRCFAIDSNVRLVADGDKWLDGQWAYSALARFVMGQVLERELVHPGYAKAAIPVVREALSNAGPLPEGTRITARRTACREDYQRRAVDELARGLGLIDKNEQAADEFTFAFSDIDGADADRVRYRIGSMRDALTWHIPDGPTAPVPQPVCAAQGELGFA
ncbi:hypothetical protein DP57_6335 [Burkholderia pseudomallei]|uniref:hypothetical protein n=1 Tax=Burkholderia pseudomallei TaxID=28450 RepID=UPI00050F395F|nr:hypothetical protein [Burkholderia pseudomallei]KGC70881.1 hypothetical protein DP57_6335 [Burkholderia pseudomallei]